MWDITSGLSPPSRALHGQKLGLMGNRSLNQSQSKSTENKKVKNSEFIFKLVGMYVDATSSSNSKACFVLFMTPATCVCKDISLYEGRTSKTPSLNDTLPRTVMRVGGWLARI